MKLCTVIGARPQFIKHAALEFALLRESDIEHIVIHTGQHYDANMSEAFFTEFNLKKPDYILDVNSQNHDKQKALMQIEVQKILIEQKPDCVIVYGDTNSTLAGALAAKKQKIKLVHIEAGLRSFNMDMPEEVNRIETDKMADILFVPSHVAMDNLKQEGMANQSVLVGDIMKDMVELAIQHKLIQSNKEGEYYYVTIHRPYNTDDIHRLQDIFQTLNKLDKRVVFSLHPRTKNFAAEYKIDLLNYENIQFIDPVFYFDNLNNINNSAALLTDSGGMQKEAYWLQTKCVTIRTETEWTETLKHNWNQLVFDDLNEIQQAIYKEAGLHDTSLYGDGRAAMKILEYIKRIIQ